MPDIPVKRKEKKYTYGWLILPFIFIIPASIIFIIKICSVSYSPVQISPPDMKEDITCYFKKIRDIHPLPNRYYTLQQLDSVKKELYNQCNHPLKLNTFLFKLMKTRYLFDDHTGCDFNSLLFEKNLLGEINSDHKFLLPQIVVKKEKAYWKNKEIIRINGDNSSIIMAELKKMVSPTNNPLYNDIYMSYLFSYYLAERYNSAKKYKLEINKDQSIEYNALQSRKEYDYTFMSTCYPVKDTANYFKHYTEDNISIFYFNTCDRSEKTIQVIEKGFNQIKEKGITHLFIDISNNGGGNDAICLHIIDKYLSHPSFNISVNQILKPCIFYNFLKIHNATHAFPSYMDSTCTEIVTRKINLSSHANKEGFTGKLIVLQGPHTYSAAILFCKLIRMLNLGDCVGKGVGHEHLFAGNIYQIRLPNSQFDIRCASTLETGNFEDYNFDKFITPQIDFNLNHNKNIDSLKSIILKLKNK